MSRILMVSGPLRAGKNTLGDAFVRYFGKTGRTYLETAFANELKKELEPSFLSLYGLNPFDLDGKEKEILRPIFVAHGEYRREKSNGEYWLRKVEETARDSAAEFLIITDCRYANEVNWGRKFCPNANLLVHVSKLIGGKEIPYKNNEEAKNDPQVKQLADFPFSWEEQGTKEELEELADSTVKTIVSQFPLFFT